MPIRIANPAVVAKISRLAAVTGLTKTAAAEKAVDGTLADHPTPSGDDFEDRAIRILAQLGRIADRMDAFEAVAWDEHGLPR